MGDPVGGCAANNALGFPGFGKPKRKKIGLIKVLHLTFKTDHASTNPASAMKDNNSDWEDTGSAFTKPEWDYGKRSKPVSHTKNLAVTVEVVFDVYPKDADSTSCTIKGTAAFGSLVFTSSGSIAGGVQTYTANSGTSLLPDEVVKLSGDIAWSVDTTDDGPFDAGASWGHIVYVTIAVPISAPSREAGITQKRMDKAVELVAGTGVAKAPWANRPHEIVSAMMAKFRFYTLQPDPAVPGVDFPSYLNPAVTAGAWHIADFIAKSGECQAIVRFVRAIIKQVGCPGLAQAMLVYADPNINNGKTVLEDDQENPPAGGAALWHVADKKVNGRDSGASLVDSYPGDAPGQIFDTAWKGRLPSIGSNAFEACLKFTYPEPGPGATPAAGAAQYYPGGSGGQGVPAMEPVIYSFYALVWLSPVPGQLGEELARIEAIVRRYRKKDKTTIPLTP